MSEQGRKGTVIGVIAPPDTGMVMTIGVATDRTGGGAVILNIGRAGHDEPDATMELGAAHVAALMEWLQDGIEALVENLGD